MSAASFRFTIDGIEVEAIEGQSVIEACDAAGIYIPRLCHHPDLEPAGPGVGRDLAAGLDGQGTGPVHGHGLLVAGLPGRAYQLAPGHDAGP